MIQQLIYVRHGQSEANAAGVYAGARSDVKLTAHGREQAIAAGLLLERERISHIIASDLDRAHQTAEIIAATINYTGPEIITDPRIRELDVGDLTGKPDTGFLDYLHYIASGQDKIAETPEQVEERLRKVLLALNYVDGHTILIVAHAGVGRVLRSMLTGVDLAKIATLDVPNAQPIHLPLDRLKEYDV